MNTPSLHSFCFPDQLLRTLCFVLLGFSFCLSTNAQSTWSGGSQKAIAKAPSSQVLDQAALFDFAPQKLSQISKQLRMLTKKYQLPVYLVTNENFLLNSPDQLAQLFYNEWIGEGNDGVVILYDVNSKQFIEGRRFQQLSTEEPKKTTPRQKIPDYILEDILRTLKKAQAPKKETTDLYHKPVTEVQKVTEYITSFQKIADEKLANHSKNPPRSSSRYLWLLGLFILLGCFLFWKLYSLSQRSQLHAEKEFTLPSVLVGTRLGARLGGGKSSEISFATDSES